MKPIIYIWMFCVLAGVCAATSIITEPISLSFTPYNTTGYSVSSIKSTQGFKSCYQDANWGTGACSYMYYCYAVLPSYSTSVNDAILKQCEDISEKTTITLSINQFVPPKGILYYVSTFITIVDYKTYNSTVGNVTTEKWRVLNTRIPSNYVKAFDLRSVCPEGQMLGVQRDPQGVFIGQKCYSAKRVCLDTLDTGLCTNAYPIYVLDTDGDGTFDEFGIATNYCTDANRDKVCDYTVSLQCVDTCRVYTVNNVTGEITCTQAGANGICDEWDIASRWSCIDDELSPNSNICDDIDIRGCLREYNPVCVGGRGGRTYPNACFAQGQGYTSTQYTNGSCEPAVLQCYLPEDCPNVNVCSGGSSVGIAKLCLSNRCAYSGACGNLQCVSDADCANMNMPCVGVTSKCSNNVCSISGQCLKPPTPETSSSGLWNLINGIFTALWNIIKAIFGLT